jgi:cytochrome c oxidase subunit 3/cytochrome o ubiquinol oxidase subunit 3
MMLALLSAFIWAGTLRPVHVEHVELVSWYWHFVDAVWVVVFTVVYLLGR